MDFFQGKNQNGYTRSGFLKNGYPLKPSKKRTLRAITLLVKSISYPFISTFLRDNDPHVHLPAADYILRRVRVQFGRLKSGWDQVWVGSGCQSPGRVLRWQACVFSWSRRVPVLCPILSTGRGYGSRTDTYVHVLFIYKYLFIYLFIITFFPSHLLSPPFLSPS